MRDFATKDYTSRLRQALSDIGSLIKSMRDGTEPVDDCHDPFYQMKLTEAEIFLQTTRHAR